MGTLSARITPTIHSIGAVTMVPVLVVNSGSDRIAFVSALRSLPGP